MNKIRLPETAICDKCSNKAIGIMGTPIVGMMLFCGNHDSIAKIEAKELNNKNIIDRYKLYYAQ